MPLTGEKKAAYMKRYHESRRLLRPPSLNPFTAAITRPARADKPKARKVKFPIWVWSRVDRIWKLSQHPPRDGEPGHYIWHSSDEVLFALVRCGLEHWDRKGLPEMDEFLRQLQRNQANTLVLQQKQEADAWLKQTKAVIRLLLDTEPSQALSYFTMRRQEITHLPEGNPLGSWMLEDLNHTFKDLAKQCRSRFSFLVEDAIDVAIDPNDPDTWPIEDPNTVTRPISSKVLKHRRKA